ncbi:MAG: protein-disulfide reductase DsbD [Congregibacter sp.]
MLNHLTPKHARTAQYMPRLSRDYALIFTSIVIGVLLSAASPLNAQGLDGLGRSGASLNGAAESIEFLPVEEAYPLSVSVLDDNRAQLVWQMPAGYYLSQHAFRFELENDGRSIAVDATLPEALIRDDEFFGRVEVYYDVADVTLSAPETVLGSTLKVTSQGCADAGLCYPPRTQNFRIALDGSVSEVRVAAPSRTSTASASVEKPLPAAPAGAAGLITMLAFAFLGGVILNLMPCVLPILSLKVLSFACATPQERHRHGLLYSAGVISGFVGFAVLLLTLRSAGQAVGWGFQLQSPGFVIALAYLFVVMGLGLSGLVELGNRFMNLGSGLAGAGGASGSFFTGLLAVVVASPCTAPFMGTALGFALVQPPLAGLTVFAALGAGMAAPMLLLSYSETARRYMPKPGPWMDRLKQALAFPLYATAIWLFWVAGRQTSVDVMAATLMGALLIAVALWLWRGAWFSRSTAIACFAAAVALATWRPALLSEGSGPSSLPAGSVAYTSAGLAELRKAGRPVFVDVTADWCITCLANERSVLSSDSVKAAFANAGVIYMVADWTDYDPEIAEFVASHGRSGIPLYVVYDGEGPGRVLPQLLRKKLVISEIQRLTETSLAAAPVTGGL